MLARTPQQHAWSQGGTRDRGPASSRSEAESSEDLLRSRRERPERGHLDAVARSRLHHATCFGRPLSGTERGTKSSPISLTVLWTEGVLGYRLGVFNQLGTFLRRHLLMSLVPSVGEVRVGHLLGGQGRLSTSVVARQCRSALGRYLWYRSVSTG